LNVTVCDPAFMRNLDVSRDIQAGVA